MHIKKYLKYSFSLIVALIFLTPLVVSAKVNIQDIRWNKPDTGPFFSSIAVDSTGVYTTQSGSTFGFRFTKRSLDTGDILRDGMLNIANNAYRGRILLYGSDIYIAGVMPENSTTVTCTVEIPDNKLWFIAKVVESGTTDWALDTTWGVNGVVSFDPGPVGGNLDNLGSAVIDSTGIYLSGKLDNCGGAGSNFQGWGISARSLINGSSVWASDTKLPVNIGSVYDSVIDASYLYVAGYAFQTPGFPVNGNSYVAKFDKSNGDPLEDYKGTEKFYSDIVDDNSWVYVTGEIGNTKTLSRFSKSNMVKDGAWTVTENTIGINRYYSLAINSDNIYAGAASDGVVRIEERLYSDGSVSDFSPVTATGITELVLDATSVYITGWGWNGTLLNFIEKRGPLDTTAPAITVTPPNPATVTQGGTYTDAGATASDNVDGNITSSIVTVNPVNTAVVGTYTVTYNVKDAAGNSATQKTRIVNVVSATSTGGAGSGTQSVSVLPTALDFGDVKINTTSPTKTVTVENTGSVDISGDVSITGVGSTQFKCVGVCSYSLQSGEKKSIAIQFNPTIIGTKNAVAQFTATGGSDKSVSLVGVGIVVSNAGNTGGGGTGTGGGGTGGGGGTTTGGGGGGTTGGGGATTPAPTLNISIDPNPVADGSKTTITWWSGNVTSPCVASGDWSGSKNPLGSEKVGPITSEKIYQLKCTGDNGNTIILSKVLKVGTICGNGTCDQGETLLGCPSDCFSLEEF